MRKLIDTPNAGGITAAYPDGSIVDQTGETTGTALTDILYGDLIQTFHKIKRISGYVENNLPDNETNGFQLLGALFSNTIPPWYAPAQRVDFSKIKFCHYNNGVYYHKTTVNTDNNPPVDTINWALVFYWNGSKIVFADEARITAIEQANTSQQSDIDALDFAVDALELTVTQYNGLLYAATQSITGATTGINSRDIIVERQGNSVCVNGYFSTTPSAATSDIIAQMEPQFYPKTTQYINVSDTEGNVIRLFLSTDGKMKYQSSLPNVQYAINNFNFSYFV